MIHHNLVDELALLSSFIDAEVIIQDILAWYKNDLNVIGKLYSRNNKQILGTTYDYLINLSSLAYIIPDDLIGYLDWMGLKR